MTREAFQAVGEALAADARLWRDFLELCDCGGRLAGSDSERAALTFAEQRLAAIDRRATRVETARYAGWRLKEARLAFPDDATPLACKALLGSQSTPPGGVSAEVIDLARGSLADFEARAADIGGRFVLVRHEYPFSAAHIHRRRKYGWALERGAAGFIIANPAAGAGPVSGSSGRGGAAGIPAVATDAESAARIAARRPARAHLTVSGEDYEAQTGLAVLELPGAGADWVVLSAHLDGHDLAESAMDNATGVAVVLAVARALAPIVPRLARGLKVCLFSAEEWALAGSRAWLDRMDAGERGRMALNVNLDTVGGDTRLTALTSEFPALDAFVRECADAAGVACGSYRPMMANSDHYNFARHGIPALRLVAGFERPESNVRHILTGADTRDKVAPAELHAAACLAAALVWRGLTASPDEIGRLRAT